MPRGPKGKRVVAGDGYSVAGKNSNGVGSVYFEPPSTRADGTVVKGRWRATYVDLDGKIKRVSGPTRGGSARQTIEVSVSRDDSVVWEDTVPGFVAALVAGPAEPIVVVLDQTGGTGEPAEGADTMLTAYAATSGDPQWQHALPGTPHLIAQISIDVLAVPVGTEVHGIDIATGTESWVTELPNPGQGGSYDQEGTF